MLKRILVSTTLIGLVYNVVAFDPAAAAMAAGPTRGKHDTNYRTEKRRHLLVRPGGKGWAEDHFGRAAISDQCDRSRYGHPAGDRRSARSSPMAAR